MENKVLAVDDRQSGWGYSSGKSETNASGVSWAAVIAGAFVAAALSLILLSLGTGLGLSSVSPWSNAGASASTISTAAVIWLILMQIIASAMGGYLAGRLRTKWATIHTDEVYFRDTAHGFLAWAVGLVIAATFLASAATSMLGGTSLSGVSGVATATGGPTDAGTFSPNGYSVDALFRSDHPSVDGDAPTRAEVSRILAKGLRQEEIPAPDKTYLAQLVAAKTGLSPIDAQARVSQVVGEARQDAAATRKAVAHLSLWLFVALLLGAFCASYAATIGGRQRDHVKLL